MERPDAIPNLNLTQFPKPTKKMALYPYIPPYFFTIQI